MGKLGGDWRFLLAEMPKGATVKPPFLGDAPRQKLATLVSKVLKKGAKPPLSADWRSQYCLFPATVCVFPTPAGRVKAAVPPPLKGQAPYEDWLRQCFYPHGTQVFSGPPNVDVLPKITPSPECSHTRKCFEQLKIFFGNFVVFYLSHSPF